EGRARAQLTAPSVSGDPVDPGRIGGDPVDLRLPGREDGSAVATGERASDELAGRADVGGRPEQLQAGDRFTVRGSGQEHLAAPARAERADVHRADAAVAAREEELARRDVDRARLTGRHELRRA